MIYNGVSVRTFDQVQRPVFVPEGDLLFSIGVIQMKKNVGVLIDFMRHLPCNYKLIMAGNKSTDYAKELQHQIDSSGLQERIIMPGTISEEDKFWMYNHCKAVLFPSRFVGMGLPPVEAMRFGKPVFASTFSSIPEICGEHAYYWTTFAPGEMASFFLEKME